jgi:hypothetical protein
MARRRHMVPDPAREPFEPGVGAGEQDVSASCGSIMGEQAPLAGSQKKRLCRLLLRQTRNELQQNLPERAGVLDLFGTGESFAKKWLGKVRSHRAKQIVSRFS